MNYTISALDPHVQRSAVLDLWSRNLPGTGRERYQWLYEGGPAIGWIARSCSEDIVGGAGLMRRRLRLFDEAVTAGQAIDMNVDRRHRAFGPARALEREVTGAAEQCGLRLLYALPNDLSEPIFRHAGYQTVGKLGRWAKPLCWKSMANHCGAGSLAGTAALKCADWFLRLASPGSWDRRSRLRSTIQEQFDDRFDRLWQSASRDLGVIGERTSTYLNWRFGRCPIMKHQVFCLSGRTDELLAYVVFSTRDHYVYISDFFGRDPRYLHAALTELLVRVKRDGAHAVVTTFLGNSKFVRILRRCGFWSRPCDWKLMILGGGIASGPPSNLLDAENWYLTRADIDTDF